MCLLHHKVNYVFITSQGKFVSITSQGELCAYDSITSQGVEVPIAL